jgi:fluoride exporter
MDLSATWRSPLAISLGAVAGALTRYYLTLWIGRLWGTYFPWGTWVINLSGCFLMGVVVTIAPVKLSPELKLMVATGFLGSYTTFSTYGLESMMLMRHGLGLALFYWLGSAVLGVGAVLGGTLLGKAILGSRPIG